MVDMMLNKVFWRYLYSNLLPQNNGQRRTCFRATVNILPKHSLYNFRNKNGTKVIL